MKDLENGTEDIIAIVDLIQEIAKGGNQLRGEYRSIISRLEKLIEQAMELAEVIRQLTGDNYLTVDEGTHLMERLQAYEKEVAEVFKDHDIYRDRLNHLISLSSAGQDLLMEKEYLSDIRSSWGDTYVGVKVTGYYIDSEVKMSIYSTVEDMLEEGPAKPRTGDEMDINRCLMDMLTYLSATHGLLIDDVLYVRQPRYMEKLAHHITRFRDALRPVVKFYKEAMFELEVKDAIEGLTRLLEHDDMKDEERIKLTGFVMKADGYGQLSELMGKIKRVT